MAAGTGSDTGTDMQQIPTRSGASPALLIVLVVALAVGAAASLVAGAATSPPFRSGPATEILLSASSIATIFAIVLAVAIGILIYVRLSSDTAAVPSRFVVTALTAILIGVLLIALFHLLGSGSGFGAGSSVGGNNSTNGGQPGSNATGNVTGSGGQLEILSFHLPTWSLFAAVALAAILVSAVAIPALRAASARRDRLGASGRSRAAKLADLRGALAVAAGELEVGGEPRTVVIRLYTTLLRRVGPMVGGVDDVTPEEIRALHFERLGIRPTAATTLTRLFEEARYSSHPMGPDAARRAREAISEAAADLDRTLPPAP